MQVVQLNCTELLKAVRGHAVNTHVYRWHSAESVDL